MAQQISPVALLQLQAMPVWVDGLPETLNPKARNPLLRRPGWKPGIHGISTSLLPPRVSRDRLFPKIGKGSPQGEGNHLRLSFLMPWALHICRNDCSL